MPPANQDPHRESSRSGVPKDGKTAPLAERMRPRTLAESVGQEHLLGPGKPLRVQIEKDNTGSMIFWGPPGVGKTTLAKIRSPIQPRPVSSNSPPCFQGSKRSNR